jgi:hypothetical protein
MSARIVVKIGERAGGDCALLAPCKPAVASDARHILHRSHASVLQRPSLPWLHVAPTTAIQTPLYGLAGSNISATLLLSELGKMKKQRQPAIHNEARVTVRFQPFQVALYLRSQPTTTNSVDGRRLNVIIFEHEKPPVGNLRWRSMIRLTAPVR